MEFKDVLQNMISNVQFRRVNNEFQKRLKNDIRSIQSLKMKKSHYQKLLTNNITKTDKQSNNNVYNSIKLEAKHITKNLKIADRVEHTFRKPAYKMLKDHKENFNIDVKGHLTNPDKSEIKKVAKIIVENINKNNREKFNYNQWRNTSDVIEWFTNPS